METAIIGIVLMGLVYWWNLGRREKVEEDMPEEFSGPPLKAAGGLVRVSIKATLIIGIAAMLIIMAILFVAVTNGAMG